MKTPASSIQRRARVGAHIAGAASLLLIASLGTISAKGKPEKPGDGGGGTNTALIEYEVTWFPGTYGYTEIYDINSSGTAVGSYHDETGTRKAFCTTADGVINPLDDWWVLPPGYEGWRMGRGEKQINENDQVCGIIVNDTTSEYELFLAYLSDPNSLESVGSVPGNSWSIHMNEYGDVVFCGYWYPHLYVRDLDMIFDYESDLDGFIPTGINDNLQVSLLYRFNNATGLVYSDSRRLTFISATDPAVLDDLDSVTDGVDDPVALAWGGINNAGTVFGCFETQAPAVRFDKRTGDLRSRTGDATAGSITTPPGVPGTWAALDPSLPTGSPLWSDQVKSASCALSANEFGQVVGGYQSLGHRSEDLWLLDPVDGLFNLDDLVVGKDADVDAAVEAFRAANAFRDVHITDIHPTTDPTATTGYGIISGYDILSDGAFILTPRLKEQP